VFGEITPNRELIQVKKSCRQLAAELFCGKFRMLQVDAATTRGTQWKMPWAVAPLAL
jgi:hypothetical protein